MAGGLPMLPPGAMPPGGGPPPGPPGMGPSPMAALAGARPPGPPPGGGGGAGGMSQQMLVFLAGLGFKDFAKTMKTLQGGDKSDKKTQAGGLVQQLGAGRSQPQNAMTPGGIPPTPPMLQGGQSPGFLALLAKLAAATQGRGM